jgi:hypothetical protein
VTRRHFIQRALLCAILILAAASPQPVRALTPQQEILLLTQANYRWVLPGFKTPGAVDCYYATFLSYPSQAACALTNTRSSQETCLWSSGNWTIAATLTPCITDLGVWSWEGRTNVEPYSNAIVTTSSQWTASNLTLTGAQSSPNGSANASEIIEDSASDAKTAISTDTTSITYGQTWTSSVFAKYTSSLRYLQLTFPSSSFGSSQYATFDLLNGIVVSGSTTGGTASITSYVNGWYRLVFTATATITASSQATDIIALSNGTNARLPSYLGAGLNALVWGAQVENNSLINSTVASAVTAASGSGGTNGTAVYSVGGGTCSITPTLNVTWTSGTLTVNSVANAGSCTTFPPSPAALTYVSGTASGWTGATVTLTPTNNASQGFASPPIPTSGSAVARAADVITQTHAPVFGASFSGLVWFTPSTPTTYTGQSRGVEINDGTNNNRVDLYRNGAGLSSLQIVTGGVNQFNPIGATWSQSAVGKMAAAVSAGSQVSYFDGVALSSGTVSPLFTASAVNIGARSSGDQQCNCGISRFAVNPTVALPTATLQTDTNLSLYIYILERDLPAATMLAGHYNATVDLDTGLPIGWLMDHVLPGIKCWEPSQDVTTVNPDPPPATITTHTYLTGYYVLVSVASAAPIPALANDANLKFILDRTKREARQAFVVKNNIGATLSNLGCQPVFESSNPYPVGDSSSLSHFSSTSGATQETTT